MQADGGVEWREVCLRTQYRLVFLRGCAGSFCGIFRVPGLPDAAGWRIISGVLFREFYAERGFGAGRGGLPRSFLEFRARFDCQNSRIFT